MENIAIFSSGNAPASSEIATLFNEGNRFHVSLLVTDNAESEAAVFMRQKGIDILVINPETPAAQPLYLVDELNKREISFIVVENFNGIIAPAVEHYIPNEVVYADKTDDLPRYFSDLFMRRNEAMPGNVRDNDLEWADAFHMKHPEPPKFPEPPAAPLPSAAPAPVPPVADAHPAAAAVPPVPKPEERPPMPSTYLIWSIVALLFCCVPGIIAIIFSSQVSSRYFSGDFKGAERSSEYAQICIIIAIALGVVANTIMIPLML